MRRGTMLGLCVSAMAVAIAPAAHAEDDFFVGLTCGFTSTSDPTGQFIQDPNTQIGEVNAGPWVVANTTGGAIDHVTVTCTIQVNDANNPGAGGVSRSNTTPGSVGVLADTINYTATPGDDVYLCTAFYWWGYKGAFWFYVDADEDDPTTGYVGKPGNQCALATSVEA